MSDERVHVKSWSELCKAVIFDGLNNREVILDNEKLHVTPQQIIELQQLYDLARRAGGRMNN